MNWGERLGGLIRAALTNSSTLPEPHIVRTMTPQKLQKRAPATTMMHTVGVQVSTKHDLGPEAEAASIWRLLSAV